MHQLFSYGTLRDPVVQRALFGREVPSAADSVPGFVIEQLTITDPDVVATSGTDSHPVLRPGTADDVVPGMRLELDDEQLAAADRYEVDDYVRTRARAVSGEVVWVYVSVDDLPT